MNSQKVVTSATVLSLKDSALAVVVVVAGFFTKFWAKTRVKTGKWDFATCQKSCYNCYKCYFFCKKVNISKGLLFQNVVTTAQNCYKVLQNCYKLLQKLLQNCNSQKPYWIYVSAFCNKCNRFGGEVANSHTKKFL